MARRFSWCTAVALVVLLFVTTEGLRERGTQVDDQKTAGRGTLRFNSRSLEESTTAPSISRSRSSQDRSPKKSNFERSDRTTLRSDSDYTTKRPNTRASDASSTESFARRTSESPVNRRNGKRYSPERTKSKDENVAIDSKVTRRVSNGRSSDPAVTERLNNTGPSVFALTTESSRSRTGRKIQTTFSTKDLKTQIPASRRYNNKKIENVETTTASIKRGRPTERSRSGRSKVNNRESNSVGRKGQDTLLYESESVRVDIPLAVEGTENPSVDVVTTAGFGVVSQRRSDTKESRGGSSRSGAERSKGRGRSSDSEAAGSSRNGSRRGSSRFNDFSTTEANEQVVGSRKSASRDRLKETRKSPESRSRSRGREQPVKNGPNGASDVKRKSTGDRNSLDRRSRLSEATSRAVESRGQEQDSRRSRSRSRTDPTTPLATDVTTTVAPDTTVFTDSTSTEPEISSTTVRPSTSTPSSTTSRSTPSSRTSTTEGSGRNRGRGRNNNQGRKQLKEDFFNHGLGFRGRKPSLDASSSTGESRRPATSKNDSQSYINPGWTLRRRPPNLNYSDNLPQTIPTSRDQTNEVIPQNEVSTSTEIVTTVETSTSTTRRGSKKPQSTEESTTEIDATTKSFRRGNKTFEKNRNVTPGKQTEHEESDNYPPEFKARLSLLKSTNTKIPAPKTTSRTPLEVKRSSAALFAERSRMKLELARRLVKPELNIEENDLDATTASSFSKPRPTVASTVDETAKVAKFVKPSATGRRTSTEKRSREDEKASKVSSRTGEDSSRFARPNSKKGRIISERMVTSISVEERAVEETTKPYSSSQSVVTLSSAEEGSATTIDTTRIRLSAARNGKKSKEETSSNKRRVDHDDTVTTFKPKKPYVYQSRATKSQEQSTTPEESLVTSKKTYASSKQNGGQRKFQSSREEDAKRSKPATAVTKPTFRPRYSKRTKPKSIDDKLAEYEATITTKVPVATSRYSRKKSVVKATEGKSKTTTEGVATQTKKLEFRPRTATYRRHSEVPTTLVESSTKVEGAGVAITPRSTKYHATLKTSTESARSVAQEPQVNLKISNDTAQEAVGITGSSNGDTGNTNIFNPTRSTILAGNGTLLEQLRSTVAPLLNSLGNKTPVFSGSYSNVNVNSAPRITPNGSPPRFSARYKGAELFVRKQNNVYQPTVPSITSSSTTPATTVETGANLGPSSSVPSFENLLSNQPGGQVTAPPGFPWRDPLDQIFGITTSSPIITASVASNSLDDSSESSNPTAARPVNPFVEIFTPLSNAIGMPRGNGALGVTGAVPSTTTMQTTPITTTMAPATSPSTPPAPTTPAPTTTTTTTTTTTPSTTTTTAAPTTTMAPTTTTTSQPTTAQAANVASQATVPSTGSTTGPLPSTTPINLPANLLTNMQQQNAFGTSFNDLVFLNSLLQDNSRGSTTKTLTQVEQLLANKILSLALNGPDPGPTRAPKAISFENASPNSVYQSPTKSYEPIVIDLSPSSTVTSPTWKPTQQTSQKPAPISSTTEQVTRKPVPTTTAKRDIDTSTAPSTVDKTTLISTTKVPVSPKAVTTPRPRTTTQAPVGLAGLLWQTLLGGGLFGPSTTQRPLKTKQVKTVTKSVNITPKPIPTTQRPETTTTARTTTTRATTPVNTIDISKIHVSTPNSIGEIEKATPVPLLSTTKQSLLNNPNPRLPVATSTFSPEEETRFLLSILRAAQQDEKASGSKKSAGVSLDDEAFLRAILSGQPLPTTTPPPQTEISNAALLAALLKAQGIEPETPATNIREQLQSASLGQSVTSAPSLSPASSGSTTIATRPTSTATRATDTTKNTVTPRPTSRPRIRTTTWSPSSTYPPPLFSSFSNYATPGQSAAAGNSDNGAIFGATRAFSQFLGAALSGAAQQLQSLVRNGTRIVSEVVG